MNKGKGIHALCMALSLFGTTRAVGYSPFAQVADPAQPIALLSVPDHPGNTPANDPEESLNRASFAQSKPDNNNETHSLDGYLASLGLVDISTLDTTLRIQLMYASDANFLKTAVYQGITRAWLRPEAARMLAEAVRTLKKEHPGWTLIVYDAARPLSVQRLMWQHVRGTANTNYVSNPANGGGLHNYGMAVDVSILDETGTPLPMGTPVDFFGSEAHTTQEDELVKEGRISRQAYENRRLLRRIMQTAGFRTIPYEWWHFNACSRPFARAHYPVIE